MIQYVFSNLKCQYDCKRCLRATSSTTCTAQGGPSFGEPRRGRIQDQMFHNDRKRFAGLHLRLPVRLEVVCLMDSGVPAPCANQDSDALNATQLIAVSESHIQ